jgi:hypothetical protein
MSDPLPISISNKRMASFSPTNNSEIFEKSTKQQRNRQSDDDLQPNIELLDLNYSDRLSHTSSMVADIDNDPDLQDLDGISVDRFDVVSVDRFDGS